MCANLQYQAQRATHAPQEEGTTQSHLETQRFWIHPQEALPPRVEEKEFA